MKSISATSSYESMVVVSSDCSEAELKNIAFNYAQQLKKLGALSISVVSRGRRDFAYRTKNAKTGYFVEIYFHSSPHIVPIFQTKLKLDKNIIRSLILNLANN
jgi:ribosomal protein S6